MQHWAIYQKWNEKLFEEMYQGWKQGRVAKNPALVSIFALLLSFSISLAMTLSCFFGNHRDGTRGSYGSSTIT
jgi:hypothetical protein